MQTATIEYPDAVRISLNVTPQEFAEELRRAAAAKLYEMGRLSSGRAAELAGMSRVQFLHEMGRYGVSAFNLTEEELLQDIASAKVR